MPYIDVGTAAVRERIELQWAAARDARDAAAVEMAEDATAETWTKRAEPMGGSCASCDEMTASIDLDGDGLVSRCEVTAPPTSNSCMARRMLTLSAATAGRTSLSRLLRLPVQGAPRCHVYGHALPAQVNALYRPLERMQREGSSALAPGCAAMYTCLSRDGSCVVAPVEQNGEAAEEAVGEILLAPRPSCLVPCPTAKLLAPRPDPLASSPVPPPTDPSATHRLAARGSTGEALCDRGDLGPWPCLEAGCEPHGIAISCSRLASSSCDARLDEVWAAPQRWAARMRVWEVCPHACGLCGGGPGAEQPDQQQGRGGQMGSCDA